MHAARRDRDRARSRSPPRRARSRAPRPGRRVGSRPSSDDTRRPIRSSAPLLARALGVEERQLAPARVGAEQGEPVGLLDHAQPEPRDRGLGHPLAAGDPERDVIERERLHREDSRASTCAGRPRAAAAPSSSSSDLRSPCSSPLRRAGRACAPWPRRVPERSPPRRPDEMSVRESRDDVFASPARARSLLTVRAAISSPCPPTVPRSSRLSLMCSYWRSRFALQALRRHLTPPSSWREESFPLSARVMPSRAGGSGRRARSRTRRRAGSAPPAPSE